MAGLIVVGLAIGVWVLWPRGDPDILPTTTLPLAVITTTSLATTTTATLATTTSDSHVVTTVEEAEEILRELWFGWFEGIYHQDEERIREVVGSQRFLNDARQAFEGMVFTSTPTPDSVAFLTVEILRSDSECLVLWSSSDLSEILGPGTERGGVDVLRWLGDRWLMISAWAFRQDLWEKDCESQLEPLS
jgi:hypothetical protein